MVRHIARAAALGLGAALLALSGCASSPKAFGITGPGGAPRSQPTSVSGVAVDPDASAPPAFNPAQDDTAIQPPGVPSDFGARYAPSIGPSYGSDGKYYGYN